MSINAEIRNVIEKLKKYQDICTNDLDVRDMLEQLNEKNILEKKVFNLTDEKQYQKLISSLESPKDNGGIYLFEFQDRTDNKVKDAFIKKYKKRKNKEKYKLSDINKHFNYDYLYIGKNEKDIDKRILEHLNCASDSTYAMKLNDDKTFCTNKIINHLKLTIYYFKGEVGWTEKLILSLLKKGLHEKYEPMIGGSRT